MRVIRHSQTQCTATLPEFRLGPSYQNVGFRSHRANRKLAISGHIVPRARVKSFAGLMAANGFRVNLSDQNGLLLSP
jgi:hypothetical protein